MMEQLCSLRVVIPAAQGVVLLFECAALLRYPFSDDDGLFRYVRVHPVDVACAVVGTDSLAVYPSVIRDTLEHEFMAQMSHLCDPVSVFQPIDQHLLVLHMAVPVQVDVLFTVVDEGHRDDRRVLDCIYPLLFSISFRIFFLLSLLFSLLSFYLALAYS